MGNSYVLSFLFYSSKSAFSRHGIVQASLPLFIWLIKDVLLLPVFLYTELIHIVSFVVDGYDYGQFLYT